MSQEPFDPKIAEAILGILQIHCPNNPGRGAMHVAAVLCSLVPERSRALGMLDMVYTAAEEFGKGES